MFYRPRCSASLAISALSILAVLPARAQTAPATGAGSPEATGSSTTASAPAAATSTPAASTVADYQIRPGDVLNINVWGHDDLSLNSVPVRPDGKISYPTIGDIYVVDQTPVRLGRIIALGIRKYLNNPKVSVTLVSSVTEKFFVTGSVAAPGAFGLTSGMGVREAVIAAGDLALDANDQSATLIRDGERIPVDLAAAMKGAAEHNLLLKPGDTLSVDRALVVFQGLVSTTGQQALRRGSTLTQALAAAGGTRDGADVERVQILRGDQTIYANLREITVDPSKDITLLPRDVIKVDAVDDRSVPIFITGAVGKQGLVRFLPGRRDTLEEALGWAGGTVQGADLKRVKLRRVDAEGNVSEAHYDLRSVEGRSVRVQANDFIEVPRKKKSTIAGNISSSLGVVLALMGLSRGRF